MTGGIRPATQVELLFFQVIHLLEENMPLKMPQCLPCITVPQTMFFVFSEHDGINCVTK